MVAQFSNSPYPFPQIDQPQALLQLKYFNYTENDFVYLRFLYHSQDPRKNSDKGRKLERLRWKEVEAYQQSGRGVYVVVNGAQGGHEDKDIKQCAAIFCEWDDRPVEDQLRHWETVGFFEPTFTVYSGDKSAQPYWVFDKPITVEQWRSLQLLLIEVMGADPANKNPSRVFRLAGGWHIKPGREPVRTEIVQDSGIKYSYEQLRDRLLELKAEVISASMPLQPTLEKTQAPAESDIAKLIGNYIPLTQCGSDWKGDCPFCSAVDQFIVKSRHQTFECLSCKTGGDADNYQNSAKAFLKKYQHSFNNAPQKIRYEDIGVPVPESVPLEVCSSKESRTLLQSGALMGGRNSNGAKLARDLIGTANHLKNIGQQFDGDPWQLFLDYCHRCQPGNGWGESEWKNIWKSAENDRPTPSCTAVGVETCIRAWYWNNHIKPTLHSNSLKSKVVVHPTLNPTGGNGSPPQSSGNSPYELVKELVRSGLSQAQLTGALIELSTNCGYPLAGLKDLAREIEVELSSTSAQSDHAKETHKLLEYREQTLDLKRVFPAPLANYLLTKADSDRIDPVFVYQYLWAGIGLSLGSHIGIQAKKGTELENDWLEFPIFYNVTVAPPSSGKSQTMRAVLGHFKRKQSKERALYKKAKKHLEELKEKWNNFSPEEKERLIDSELNPKVYAQQMPQPPKTQLIEAGSPEGAFKRMSELPPMSGCALAFDELIRILSLDQYKNQGGDSRQILMEAWAYPFSTEFERANGDDSVGLQKIGINITGGIQPALAKKLLSDPDDGDGLLSRFLIAQTLTPSNFAVWSDTQVDIAQALSGLYEFLSGLHFDLRKRIYGDDYLTSIVNGEQVILRFEPRAEKRWHQWWEHLRSQMQRVEHENPALYGYLGKMLSQTLRIALALHCIELMYEDKADPLTVGLATLEKAIYCAKFHIGQFRLLQANNDTSNLPGQLALIHQYAQRKGQACSATQVQNTVFKRSQKKPTLATIREYFKQIADAGIATLIGAGKELKLLVQKVVGIPTNSEQYSDKTKTPETTIQQEFQSENRKNSDNSDNVLSPPSDFITPLYQPPKEVSELPEVLPDPWVESDDDLANNEKCRKCRIKEDSLPSDPEPEPVVVALQVSEESSEPVGNSDTASTCEDDLPEGRRSNVPGGTGFGVRAEPNQPQETETVRQITVGATVAHSDPYTVAYSYHGTVFSVNGDTATVRWAERRGKPNECETYKLSELRLLEKANE